MGLAGSDGIQTGAGNDYLNGGEGNDYLYDGDGDDTVFGGAGVDAIYVDAGDDIYYGGDGNDALLFDYLHQANNVSQKSTGGVTVDLALTSVQDFGEHGRDRVYGVENVSGSFGDDKIYGTFDVNVLHGNDGHDLIDGRGGDDELWGGHGGDTLIGGLGADKISTFIPALAELIAGRDIIRYEALNESGTTSSTWDQIFWFVSGEDKIDLSKIDANLGLKGNQAFKVVKGFTKAFGEVKIVKSGADTLVQVDGDRDKAVDMTIYVSGVHLTKGDFIL